MGSQIDRCDRRVRDYALYRPSYPVEVIDRIRDVWSELKSGTVADVGCGTGISSELFLKAGFQVIGIEPNAEMRSATLQQLGSIEHFESRDGRADATGLSSNSIDLVVVAQAFHWFEVKPTQAEFIRILRPPGRTALIWNTLRSETPFLRDYEMLLQQFGIDYRSVCHKNLNDDVFNEFFRFGWKYFQLPNVQVLDWRGAQGRLQSSSFTPNDDHPQFAPMMDRLQEIFQKHQEHGMLRYEYDTEIYCGELSAI